MKKSRLMPLMFLAVIVMLLTGCVNGQGDITHTQNPNALSGQVKVTLHKYGNHRN